MPKQTAGPKHTVPSTDGRLEAALAEHQAGRFASARDGYLEILSENPDHAGALHLLGVLELQQGDPLRAQDLLQKSLGLKPDFAPGYNNLGNAAKALGDLLAAEAAFRRAVELDPSLAVAHGNLASALLEMGRADEAVKVARVGITLEPDNAMILSTLGAALATAGDRDAAILNLQAALACDPGNAPAYSNLGNLLLEQRDLEGAVSACRKAIELAPGLAAAHGNLANALRDQGRIEEALSAYRMALKVDPGRPVVQSNYLLCLQYDSQTSADRIFSETIRWAGGRDATATPEKELFGNNPDPDRPLTIGYVSADFRAHSVSGFVAPLFAARNSARFRTLCYAEVAQPDATTEKLRGLVDGWWSTVGQTDQQVAAQVRSDQVDILVDLSGHTGGNRLGAFSHRLAPIQVTWLGYPGTTGVTAMDYRLTDKVADPMASDGDYTESLIRLPQGFLCYDPPSEAPEPAPPPCKDRGFVTFGSFNTLAKISPEVVAAWARILMSVDGSVLVLKNRALADPGARARYFDLFAAHGVTPERVQLHPWTASIEDHLAVYNSIDIALDTFPYNGTTTTLEALWMGVPVVSLLGDRHAARVGASILERLERSDWVATTVEGYVATAVALARRGDELRRQRDTLRAHMAQSSLCDAGCFARAIEAAYQDMWRTWLENRA